MAPQIHTGKSVSSEDLDKVRFLLSAKKLATTSKEDRSSYDALLKAIEEDRQSVINMLLEKGSRAVKKGHALQTVVAKMDWPSVAELLLYLGARASDTNSNGDTALHVTFMNGATERAANLLLNNYLAETTDSGANDDGLTFLHIACSRWSVSFAQKIIDRGVKDINHQVHFHGRSQYAGYSPLHFAVQFGNRKTASLLLNNGADVNVQDATDSTPIHLALQKKDMQMVDLLFSHDQRKENLINDLGLTHFMAACAGGASHVVEKFLHDRRDRLVPSNLMNSRVIGSGERLYAGYSPIHFASEFGNLNSVKLLLDNGASYLPTTARGWTPATFARNAGRRDILGVIQQTKVKRGFPALLEHLW